MDFPSSLGGRRHFLLKRQMQREGCYAAIIALSVVLLVWLDSTFLILGSFMINRAEADKSVRGSPHRKSLSTFNGTNNIWKNSEL